MQQDAAESAEKEAITDPMLGNIHRYHFCVATRRCAVLVSGRPMIPLVTENNQFNIIICLI